MIASVEEVTAILGIGVIKFISSPISYTAAFVELLLS